MLTILQSLQKTVYSLREYFWNFPESLFLGNKSPYHRIRDMYSSSRPFSHFFFLIIIIFVIVSLVITDVNAFFRVNTGTYVEGVIVGVEENGQIRKLNRISPLIVSDIQLEKDITELIYESLIFVDQKGEVKNVLIEKYESKETGTSFTFFLKKGVFWHDGVELTSKDVESTFKLLRELNNSPETSSISSRASLNIEYKTVDDYTFEFSFKENTVVPNFFEAMSFKILPSHLVGDINSRNANTSDPILNRAPVGTGPFKFLRSDDKSITLRKNTDYRDAVNFNFLKFNLYPNELSAINAIRSGQIHGLAGISIDKLQELQDVQSLQILKSGVIYNQYYALYFNLQKDIFKDKKVRQAVASAINPQSIQEALMGYAQSANSPIPQINFAYAEVNRFGYDTEKAKELLDQAGWVLPEGKIYREKDGKQLSFEIYHVDNIDRNKIQSVIEDDLAEVGIQIVSKPVTLSELRDQHIIPKQFDTVLYGVQTFIDPDRYELFHSSQIDHPGLNISSYSSEKDVLSIVPDPDIPGKSISKRIPEVDDLLDDARKITDKKIRTQRYAIFQEIIADEVPVVFLYHPIETYIINKRAKNIDISQINSIEERFSSANVWSISLD